MLATHKARLHKFTHTKHTYGTVYPKINWYQRSKRQESDVFMDACNFSSKRIIISLAMNRRIPSITNEMRGLWRKANSKNEHHCVSIRAVAKVMRLDFDVLKSERVPNSESEMQKKKTTQENYFAIVGTWEAKSKSTWKRKNMKLYIHIYANEIRIGHRDKCMCVPYTSFAFFVSSSSSICGCLVWLKLHCICCKLLSSKLIYIVAFSDDTDYYNSTFHVY